MIAVLPEDLIVYTLCKCSCTEIVLFSKVCRVARMICTFRISKDKVYAATSSKEVFRWTARDEQFLKCESLAHHAAFHGDLETFRYLHSLLGASRISQFAKFDGVEAYMLTKVAFSDLDKLEVHQPQLEKLTMLGARCTALHVAAYMGNVEVCRYLLTHAPQLASVATTEYSDTALHLAVECNHIDVIRVLLDANADIAAETDTSLQPIHFANSCEAVDLLVERGACISAQTIHNDQLIHFAAQSGDAHFLKHLHTHHDADIGAINAESSQPLHFASYNGACSTLKYLLRQGILVDATTMSGWSVIHGACFSGHLNIVEHAHAVCGNLLARDNRGWTGLHYAISEDHVPIVQYYYTTNAFENISHVAIGIGENVYSVDLVHLAACSNLSTLCYLHEHCNLSLAETTVDGKQPMHFAAMTANIEAVRYIWKHLESCSMKPDHAGYSPMHYAQEMFNNKESVGSDDRERYEYTRVLNFLCKNICS